MNPARLAAARILVALDRGSTTLSRELDIVRADVTRNDDRGLLLELVAGTLRWRNELDALVGAASHRPVPDLDAGVRAILRLGIYQLRHLDKVPAHAILHESVELTRALHRPKAAGFVNAVLRTLTRSDAATPLPKRPLDEHDRQACLAYLSVTLSHPEWLVARWLDRYGFSTTEAWCQYNNTVPEPALRVKHGQAHSLVSALAATGITATPARFVGRCVRLPAGALSRIAPHLRERLLVQDEGSQLVAESVPVSPGDRILDACAAPGGKTLVLAERVEAGGSLIASDFRAGRTTLLARMLSPLEPAVPVVRFDASRPWPFGPVFDSILLDVPCTGLGTVRRDPDVKWARSSEDLARFSGLQRSMLQSAASSVRPGGAVVYATCSSEPEENIEIVDAFLDRNPEFRLTRAVPGPGVREADTLVDARGCVTTDPVRHGLDAFFAAVLVRSLGP